jgi:hypothetical protein
MGEHFLLLSIGFESGRISLVFEGVFEKKFKQGERGISYGLAGVFEGCFEKSCVFLMVNLWSFCGELRGKRGELTAGFDPLIICHFFQLYFRSKPGTG